MYRGKTVGAIIVAAGAGKRMGTLTPKQFLKIDGKPMIAKTASAFEQSQHIDGFFIVTGQEYIKYVANELSRMKKLKSVVAGGEERQDSVKSGLVALMSADENYDYILIHDGARPYVGQDLIERVLENLVGKDDIGGVIPVVAVKDTIKKTCQGMVEATLHRSELRAVQTPQGFPAEILVQAYEMAEKEGLSATDDSMMVEALGKNVLCVEGDYHNIKITTKEDMPMENRIGSGFDVHRLVEGRDLIIGGVHIPHKVGLLGHSDADVLTHAVMDALLGAAALGDIGGHFPDTEEKYKGISSLSLLKEVGELLRGEGYGVVNIDATIMAEAPKMAPYIEEMRRNISDRLNIDIQKVNIKATTTESLGFVGREEGIAASAVCIIA